MKTAKQMSAYLIETQPGSNGAMAPPTGWSGTFNEYREQMRQLFRSNHEARQCMAIASMRFDPSPKHSPVTFRGAYADWAKALIQAANAELKARKSQH